MSRTHANDHLSSFMAARVARRAGGSSNLEPESHVRRADGPETVVRAAVVGASGFTGALLAELLLRHPQVEVAALTSESAAGSPVAALLPRLHTPLSFVSAAEVAGVDIAFVCLPHGEAAPVVLRLLEGGTRVIDLSADFRLDAQLYAEWYGVHPEPGLLPAVYGLTEHHRAEIAAASLVANPGCYPTAALLALLPLRDLDLLDIVIDAKSGVSGAGRAATERTHFCSVDSDLGVYGLPAHRHYPEIAAPLGALRRGGPSLVFVPHLVPLQRGILETIYVQVAAGARLSEVLDRYRAAYREERFVRVVERPPHLRDVAGTNECHLFATVDERTGKLLLVSALDNLMKGAAGQAVQNMNLMLGLPEQTGLL